VTPNPQLDAWQQGIVRQMVSWPFYAPLDALRRLAGAWLDLGGLGRNEAPYAIVRKEPGVSLRAYASEGNGPAVLLVPAPIKDANIWDLLPRASVVRLLLAQGFRVYLADWQRPSAAERELGLADYADRLLGDCLDAIGAQTGEARVLLAAHSLGGTLAAIFAALHPERLRGLALLGAPLNFGDDFGAFAPIVALSPPAARITAAQGNVPGTFLDSVSLIASPETFAWSRLRDFASCLPDAEAMATHLAVERWSLEEKPLAARLFEDVWEQLFRDNRFMAGTLAIGARAAAPAAVTAPLLCAVDARCAIAPPQSMLPFYRAAASRDKKLLWYEGDRGVSLEHVGMLVGRNAHRSLWPEIARWMAAL
jgi:polyhydroxyalkanoate synthase